MKKLRALLDNNWGFKVLGAAVVVVFAGLLAFLITVEAVEVMTSSPSVSEDNFTSVGWVREFPYRLSDGRTVTCLTTSNGITCDWTNAK